MFGVGLTGGIASGKSAVAARFAARGIVVVDADIAAREVVEPGQPALQAIVEAFGADVLREDGTLDRGALRRHVFGDEVARHTLEAILHPRIREQMHADALRADGPYVIVAVPLLAEIGGRKAYPWLSRILVVDVPREVQLARLVRRDGIEVALAERMVAAQADRASRLAIADDVIVNEGALALLDAEVDALDRRYRALAGGF